jgi:tetratricopeptide (TPR) repeat protein
MTKEICPFLGKLRDENRPEGSCIQEQCMFYHAQESRCIFLEIGTASREYLESLKKLAEHNELNLLKERASMFSADEKSERVGLYISQAGIFKNKGNFAKALLEYRKALTLDPENAEVHKALGDIYSIQGILDESISSYRQSLKKLPEDGETWIRMILQYRAMCANQPDRENRYREIIEKLRDDLRSIESESMANCIIGNAYLILHSSDSEKFLVQRQEARVMMERAIEINPSNIWANLGLKDLMIYDANYEGAIERLLSALKKLPDDPRLNFELGECYLVAQIEHAMSTEDALPKANESYSKALKLNPGYAPACFRLGYISEQKASYDQAIDFYQQGLAINPTNIFAHFRLGRIHLLMGMYELAITRFKEVIELSRNRTHEIYQEGYLFNKLRFFKEANALGAWIELGKIYVKRRQYDEAAEAFRKALEIDRSSPLAIMNQIDLFKIRTGESKDSETQFNRLVEQYKNSAMVDFQNPVAHFALAYACQILPSILPEKQEERLEEALNGYQMAINLTPDFKWAYWGLKNSYLTTIENSTPLYDQALEACKLVTELDPEDPRAYFETGDVYLRMGNLQMAYDCFATASEKDKTYIPAWLNMAEIKFREHKDDEAVRLYQKVIRINPNFAQGYYELGRVYKEIRENEKALANLRKAIELDIDYTEAHFAIGQICFEERQDEIARIRFSRVIELAPTYAPAHYFLGLLHHRNGRFQQAIEEFNTAIDLSHEPARIQFDLARLYADAGNWNEAKNLLEVVLAANPDFIDAVIQYAQTLERLDMPKDAEDEYIRAIEIAPECLPAHESLARLYETTNQIYKAEDEYRKVVSIKPDHVDAQMALAKIYIVRDLHDKALDALHTVVEIKPDIFEAISNLAASTTPPCLDKAVDSYLHAIKIRPEAPQAHVELAEVYLNQDRAAKAIEEYNRALEIDLSLTEALTNSAISTIFRKLRTCRQLLPRLVEMEPQNHSARFRHAETYYHCGQLEKALDEYLKVAEINEERTDALIRLGKIYASLEKWEDAAKFYNRVFETDPQNSIIHFELGKVYDHLNRLTDALREFEAALEREPNNPEIVTQIGLIHRKQGNLDLAIERFNRAIQIDTANPIPHRELAMAYINKGRVDKAIGEFKEALVYEPGNIAVNVELAKAYASQGIVDDAVEAYRRVIGLDPRNSAAHFELGVIYSTQGQNEAAISEFKTVIGLAPEHRRAHLELGVICAIPAVLMKPLTNCANRSGLILKTP